MKPRITLALALIALLAIVAYAAVPVPAQQKYFTISWEHPAEAPNGNPAWTYRVYQSQDFVNWSVLTNAPGTNKAVQILLKRGQWFFYATTVDPSNPWGESDPSNEDRVSGPPPNPRSVAASASGGL